MRESAIAGPAISISGRMIGRDHPVLLVAELGINHNGSIEQALAMIDAAADAGAHGVKFQTFSADEFMSSADQTYTYLSQGVQVTESMHAMFRRYELSAPEFQAMFDRARQRGLIAFSTPTDMESARLLMPMGLPALKVGSDDLVNTPLIGELAGLGIPMILSTGMADLEEIDLACEAFRQAPGNCGQLGLMVCTSLYPTEDPDANVARISTLMASQPEAVTGFSDHTRDSLAACLSVALGAAIVEKHFTLDRNLPGPDHWFSCDPHDLAVLARDLERSAAILGNGIPGPAPGELEMRAIARRSIFANQPIAAGSKVSREHLVFQRPGTGLTPNRLESVVNRVALRDIPAGTLITMDLLSGDEARDE